MNDQKEQVQTITDPPAVSVFDADDLKTVAKFLDALMEAELSLDERLIPNAC